METNVINQPEIDLNLWDLAKLTYQATDGESAEALNIWQKISEATGTVVTPANALDSVAFVGGIYGVHNLDSWKGIIIAAASFGEDYVNGKLARATKTQSPLGEGVDATSDKIKLAYALYQVWKLDLAPKPLILAIAAQNGINAALTIADRALNEKPVLHPSQFGKKAIFFEQMGIGLNVIGSEVAKKSERKARIIKNVGTIISVAGLGMGAVATTGYTTKLFSAVKRKAK